MSRGTHHASSNRLLDMFLRTMVAFALDNGLAWVTRFCTVMPDDWESSWSWGNFRGYDERLTEAGVDLTICLGGTGDSTQVEAVVQYLSRILDSRMKFLTTSPRRMQVAEDDWCLTALASNRSWIAVPGAAADLAYPTKRAWVLEPFEFVDGPEKLEKVYESGAPLLSSDHEPARTPLELIGGSWRLRKRQVVYGCQNIVADGVHVLRLPRQRVYGAEDYDWEASQGVQREDFGQDSGS
ncbi:hypothetical protein EJ04DRAFT_452169 [Polyplosphaeria fusca]|uniref:Uncharacterized protein n=1 Tax=Polyplosphaeria fusca TaxID=682080 RepID=A0A9P4QLH2_9PLEO|nr:hypothetical protein EJ04DRAFT_452169 [Polyplosphaeria fusca]